jgi:hypothetical protein
VDVVSAVDVVATENVVASAVAATVVTVAVTVFTVDVTAAASFQHK